MEFGLNNAKLGKMPSVKVKIGVDQHFGGSIAISI